MEFYFFAKPFYFLGKGGLEEIGCLNTDSFIGELKQVPFGAS